MWLLKATLVPGVLGGTVLAKAMCAQAVDWQSATSIYQFTAKDIDGNEVSLEKYKGGVCIITNFAGQEPGTDAQIKEFAKGFNAKFDLFSKIDVNGDNAHPLWSWMKVQPKGKGLMGNRIKWNYTKFLINKEGQVVKRYGPPDNPNVMEKDLSQYL
ncbi:hypothetical protein NHX12_003860 [Muraenolepis orangiensis]|uniref:Glutathione peroxidase n=1 Tax=Muraenolepis orangiensis TaxID=630683 RepID=A0A9Q0IE59_9TELE|nr:hypothetical protein NHX12_003860 [Muraenolepis orangiensis]